MKGKILLILHFPPPIHGASVIGGFIKNSGLINEHFNCYYINLGTSISVKEIGKNPAIKVLRYFGLIWQLIKALLIFRPNICYLTISAKSIGFFKDALIVLLVRLFGVKRIYHLHNKGVSLMQGRFPDNLLYKIIFKNAFVILLSKHLYPDVQKYVPVNRVYYCPNGIPAVNGERNKVKGNFEKVEVSLHHADISLLPFSTNAENVVKIFFLSHLIESKGIFVLIDALKIIKKKGILFHCTMIGGAGDVTEEQMNNRIVAAELTGYVDVVGSKYGIAKHKTFEEADIFVHPTFSDCLPLVLLEAMQYSLPIVSTIEGAIPDVVEEGVTGFLVPPRDTSALADKLEVLINDPDLRKVMGSAGRAKFEREFTIERFENRIKEILEEIVSDQNRQMPIISLNKS